MSCESTLFSSMLYETWEAMIIRNELNFRKFIVMLVLQYKILQKINIVSKYLQYLSVNLLTVFLLLKQAQSNNTDYYSTTDSMLQSINNVTGKFSPFQLQIVYNLKEEEIIEQSNVRTMYILLNRFVLHFAPTNYKFSK